MIASDDFPTQQKQFLDEWLLFQRENESWGLYPLLGSLLVLLCLIVNVGYAEAHNLATPAWLIVLAFLLILVLSIIYMVEHDKLLEQFLTQNPHYRARAAEYLGLMYGNGHYRNF